jgi:hypothetical protein
MYEVWRKVLNRGTQSLDGSSVPDCRCRQDNGIHTVDTRVVILEQPYVVTVLSK